VFDVRTERTTPLFADEAETQVVPLEVSTLPLGPGVTISIFDEIAVAMLSNSVLISVPFTTFPALPLGKESLAAKLVLLV
jgi:hypothetical protein